MGQDIVERNCIGFARFRLGLDPEEKYIDPINVMVRDLKTNFQASDPARADAVAIIGHIYGQIRVVHMAVRLNMGTERYEHRPCYGAKYRVVDDDEIQPDGSHCYSDEPEQPMSERKIYLKLIS